MESTTEVTQKKNSSFSGTDKPVDVGVIGVGSMGHHHARVYNQVTGANLVGVTDVDDARANEVADEFDTEAVSQQELLKRVDAVSVVVPTQFHHNIAMECIERRIDILIEKPLAGTIDEATAIIEAAEAVNVTLQVGHVERFNPAVVELSSIVNPNEIIGIRAERLGPPPEREVHDNAVVDLMIHDIDIVRSLIDGEPQKIQSSGTKEGRHATATIEFDSGAVANLTASRITQRKVRRLRVTTEDRVIEVDYLDQSVEVHRCSRPEYLEHKSGGIKHQEKNIIEQHQIPSYEPLNAELEEFIEAIVNNRAPKVDGKAGLKAINLVEEINRGVEREQ